MALKTLHDLAPNALHSLIFQYNLHVLQIVSHTSPLITVDNLPAHLISTHSPGREQPRYHVLPGQPWLLSGEDRSTVTQGGSPLASQQPIRFLLEI